MVINIILSMFFLHPSRHGPGRAVRRSSINPRALCCLLTLATMLFLGLPGCGPAGERGDPEVLVFAFQRQADPAQISEAAGRVAEFLSERLGMRVRHEVPSSYAASVQGMVSGQVDVAYVSAVPYLLARQDAGARVILAEVRTDAQAVERTDYDSVFVVRRESELGSVADLVEQAGELRMAFTSSTSTSGHIFPYRRLVQEGLLEAGDDPKQHFRSAVFAGGYSQALQQVLHDQADVAAVSFYTVEGPTRNVYLPEEDQQRLRVLDRNPGVPTHLICVRRGLSDALVERITEALIQLAEHHPELLAEVYGATRLQEVDESHVDAAAEAVRFTQMELGGLVR